MPENSAFSPVLTGRERTAVPTESLSFIEGVSMIVGTNISAGVLSIAYASSKAGFLPLLFWLVLVGSLTTVTMLYIVESAFHARKYLQLSGLSKRYVSDFGALMMFLFVCVNSVGALTAYMTGNDKLLHSLFGTSPVLGSMLSFVPTAEVLYPGLKAIDRSEKSISIGAVMMISVLVVTTLLKETTRAGYLLDGNWPYMVPVPNVVALCPSAQYIVPEMARGFADKPEKLPGAIMVGMALAFASLALVPLSVISPNGLDNISDMVAISWGRVLGEWTFLSTNLFVLCAMLTPYWGLGGSFLTNVFDQFRLGNNEQPARRLMVLLVVAISPFVLAYNGVVFFVNALYFAGVLSGVILSTMPIPMLKGARQRGDLTPGWTCPVRMTHPLIQCFIVLLYLCSAVHATASAIGYLPAGR